MAKTKKHTIIQERFLGNRDAHARCRGCSWTGKAGDAKPPMCPNDPSLDAAGELALLETAMVNHRWAEHMGNGASTLVDAMPSTIEAMRKQVAPYAKAVQDFGFVHVSHVLYQEREFMESLRRLADMIEAAPDTAPALLRATADRHAAKLGDL